MQADPSNCTNTFPLYFPVYIITRFTMYGLLVAELNKLFVACEQQQHQTLRQYY